MSVCSERPAPAPSMLYNSVQTRAMTVESLPDRTHEARVSSLVSNGLSSSMKVIVSPNIAGIATPGNMKRSKTTDSPLMTVRRNVTAEELSKPGSAPASLTNGAGSESDTSNSTSVNSNGTSPGSASNKTDSVSKKKIKKKMPIFAFLRQKQRTS